VPKFALGKVEIAPSRKKQLFTFMFMGGLRGEPQRCVERRKRELAILRTPRFLERCVRDQKDKEGMVFLRQGRAYHGRCILRNRRDIGIL